VSESVPHNYEKNGLKSSGNTKNKDWEGHFLQHVEIFFSFEIQAVLHFFFETKDTKMRSLITDIFFFQKKISASFISF